MKIQVSLENCYGIRKLDADFDFSDEHKVYSIYAPNGSMKTSLAKTFKDVSESKESKDIIFPERETKRSIKKDGEDIEHKNVLSIAPYIKDLDANKNIATLLVNPKLRKEYEKIYTDIDAAKNKLLEGLKKASGLKQDIEEEISKVFMQGEINKFPEALKIIAGRSDQINFGNINYNKIFQNKVSEFLKNSETMKKIKDYIEQYDALISNSNYFKKGVFNHSQAEEVATQLTKNGFFNAEHSVVLKGGRNIATKEELIEVIEHEKQEILKDKHLQNIFGNIDKQLVKNQDLRDFREYLMHNQIILPEFANLDSFKAKLWISYFRDCEALSNEFLSAYEEGEEGIKQIIEKAKEEKDEWIKVVDTFNERFFVPFRLKVNNRVEAILGTEIPTVGFEFIDQESRSAQSVAKTTLLEVLSQGERRALYILNIIFEIEARKQDGHATLFVIDDIADSFDYKNKYAIIEYLRDISKEPMFYQLILTHNFDFHRTVSSRLNMKRENQLNVIRSGDETKLVKEKYKSDPFVDWSRNLNDSKKLIATIPFVRNLAKYGDHKEVCRCLTSFLHIKANTGELTVMKLKDLFKSVLSENHINKIKDENIKFMELLGRQAELIVESSEEYMELESKIVLSIAIRLRAEEFMKKNISSVDDITYNQTYEFSKRYKESHPNETKNIQIIDRVNLMTPENIHLNSFMYEPILDMSGDHLKKLYGEVKSLS